MDQLGAVGGAEGCLGDGDALSRQPPLQCHLKLDTAWAPLRHTHGAKLRYEHINQLWCHVRHFLRLPES